MINKIVVQQPNERGKKHNTLYQFNSLLENDKLKAGGLSLIVVKDIEQNTSFTAMIGAATEPARLLQKVDG